MYASLGQLIRGWSRILYDALDRKPWRCSSAARPVGFLPERHVASWLRWSCSPAGSRALRDLAALPEPRSHALMYPVFRLVYDTSYPARGTSCGIAGKPLIDAILVALPGCASRGASPGAEPATEPDPFNPARTETTELQESAERSPERKVLEMLCEPGEPRDRIIPSSLVGLAAAGYARALFRDDSRFHSRWNS